MALILEPPNAVADRTAAAEMVVGTSAAVRIAELPIVVAVPTWAEVPTWAVVGISGIRIEVVDRNVVAVLIYEVDRISAPPSVVLI